MPRQGNLTLPAGNPEIHFFSANIIKIDYTDPAA
jgi:hypothetical protein